MVRKLTLALGTAGLVAVGVWQRNENVAVPEEGPPAPLARTSLAPASHGRSAMQTSSPSPAPIQVDHESIASGLIKANAPVAQIEAALRDALRARPNSGYALGVLADLLRADGRAVDLESLARGVLADCPDCPDATLLLGETLASHGDADGAIAEYQRATRLSSVSEVAWRALADLYEKNGEFTRARHALESATSLAQSAGAFVPAALERDRERIARLTATEE